tara:strand:+ start:5646 stop:6092 length:447 start_codon:yes stop_codon:yes gene_type:complete
MNQTFSTTFDDEGVKYTWEIYKLQARFSAYEPIYWEIPETFLTNWTWGEDHPSAHIHRCMNADYSYPILIWDGMIVDGCHRVCRAISEGYTQIRAIEIINMPPPDLDEKLEVREVPPEPPKWTFEDMIKILRAIREVEYDFRHPIDGV